VDFRSDLDVVANREKSLFLLGINLFPGLIMSLLIVIILSNNRMISEQ
jgi:hypothetical protein